MKKANKLLNYTLGAGLLCGSLACEKTSDNKEDNPDDNKKTETKAPNVLLIIADDMGIDACPGYSTGAVKPNMPNLNSMISKGVVYNNVWSAPVSSPTRATILTGKYGFKTGITNIDLELSTNEKSLFSYIEENSPNNYSSCAIGKWHLGGSMSNETHPNDMGINHYSGYLGGGVNNYSKFKLTTNGTSKVTTDYATTKFTDLAIDWIKEQDTTKPWLLWLAYNAPHTPIHAPAEKLHSQGSLSTAEADISANPLPYFMAMIEAMDSEMGRLINSMSPEERDNTIIIFIGDNGTSTKVAQSPITRGKAKGSLYQGGINVPMVISGKGVTRYNTSDNSLINTTDLYATIADITGCGITSIHDSKSFNKSFTSEIENFRDYNYSELMSESTKGWTIRNKSYKLINYTNGTQELYNLTDDAYENTDLSSSTDSEIKAVLTELTNKGKEIRGE